MRPRSGELHRYNGATATSSPSELAVQVHRVPSPKLRHHGINHSGDWKGVASGQRRCSSRQAGRSASKASALRTACRISGSDIHQVRSEEHTSELQSHVNLVCRLLLEKKKKKE